MASFGGKKTFDPFQTFDVSPEVKKAAEERAKVRAQMKAEWQKKVTNPHRATGDYIFDPAIQRFNSMRVSQYDYFKVNPKTTAWGMGLMVVPIVGLAWLAIILKEIYWTHSHDSLYTGSPYVNNVVSKFQEVMKAIENGRRTKKNGEMEK